MLGPDTGKPKNTSQKPVKEQTTRLLWQNNPHRLHLLTLPSLKPPGFAGSCQILFNEQDVPLGIGNISYIVIYLPVLKVKHSKTAATLSSLEQPHPMVASAFTLCPTRHSSTGLGPPASSGPPHCPRVLACSSASTSAVNISTPEIEQSTDATAAHHLGTQLYQNHGCSIAMASLPPCPLLGCCTATMKVAVLSKPWGITRNKIIVEL